MTRPGVYVASPLGFSEPGARYLEGVLHPALRAEGYDVLDPWAAGREILEQAEETDEATVNRLLGARNRDLIDSAAGLLAVLDGSDVDSGTASEIGYAAGIGRPVVGLRTDFRHAGDNPSAIVNLQVLFFLEATGGRVATSLEDALEGLEQAIGGGRDRPLLYHLTTRARLAEEVAAGSFQESTLDERLDEVGFIHCSYRHQLDGTARRFYAELEPSSLVALVIDPARLRAPLREEAAGGGERFPHVYGPIDLDAIVAVQSLERLDGHYRLGAARALQG